MQKDNKLLIQEDEYKFPYHYIPNYHNNFSQTLNWSWGIKYVSTIEFLIDKLSKLGFDTLCDIGAGDGRLVRELSCNFRDAEITGIDYSSKPLNLAKALNPDRQFICADIINDNIDQKFDVITMIEVFEHIPLDLTQNFVIALHRLLNHNGILLLTVPHKNKPLQQKHFQHFSLDSLKEHFDSYFEFCEVIYFEKRCKLTTIILNILSNRFFILNHQGCKNFLYKLYKEKCFYADENNCSRLFLKLHKK